VAGGSLTVLSTPSGVITCRPSTQAGNSLQATCRVQQGAASQQYSLQVTWLTDAQQTSSANTAVQVVSAGS
jgi:hypothetical protein